MALRFNPPPGWPVPAGFVPPAGWQPEPTWPPVPAGWQLWVNDDANPLSAGTVTAPFPGQLPDQPGYYQDQTQIPGQGQFAGQAQFPGQAQYPGQYPGQAQFQGQYQDQYPGQAPHQMYTYGAQPPKAGTNAFAVVSFILGLIGGILLSVIFGIIALVQIKNRGQRGRGFAIAGLVLSGIWLVVVVGLLAANVTTTAHRSANGKISGTGQVNIFSLRTGDCFQNPPPSATAGGVTNVTAVACTTAHNAQVFAQFDATDSSYPGGSALTKEADKGCNARIDSDLDKSKLTATMSLRFLYPEANSWADGRRSISCLVVDSTADLTTSLLKG